MRMTHGIAPGRFPAIGDRSLGPTIGRRGFSLVEIIVVIAIIAVLVALLLPAVQQARESARRAQCKNNLRQLGLALHNYEGTHSVYPFGVGGDLGGPPATYSSPTGRRYSLHTQILPFLDQGPLYQRIDFGIPPFFPDTSGDPPAFTSWNFNEPAAITKIPVFECPSDLFRLRRPWGSNNYRSCSGSTWSGRASDGMFSLNSGVKPRDVTDGLSLTAAFSERIRGDDDDNRVDRQGDIFKLGPGWTEATFSHECRTLVEPLPATVIKQASNGGMTWLEGNMNWTRYNHLLSPGAPSCKADITWNGVAMTANSRHAGGVHVLFGDGAVRFISENINPVVWSALGTIAGREPESNEAF